MSRHPQHLAESISQNVEVVGGDVLDQQSLIRALAGVEVAYYFVHSMGAKGDFEQADRSAALNFAEAAEAAGVRRIIYLGGLGDEREESGRSCPHTCAAGKRSAGCSLQPECR
jgi:uncharacterized protein YbjT (DUF2867 family)